MDVSGTQLVADEGHAELESLSMSAGWAAWQANGYGAVKGVRMGGASGEVKVGSV